VAVGLAGDLVGVGVWKVTWEHRGFKEEAPSRGEERRSI